MIRIWRKETKSGHILIKSTPTVNKGKTPTASDHSNQPGV
jgi:hypothetical protein